MKAMILAAGMGTRLRPLTDPVPKPMVPILNTPVMGYSLKLLQKHGIKDVIANTHYSPYYITDFFQDGAEFGVKLQYSYEKELLGTAGGVKNNRDFLDETFFVLSGDALTDIDLTAMYEFHRSQKALATIALKPVKDVSNYGVVVTDEYSRIRSFQEKPKKKEALSNVVNTGIYLFEPEIFDYIPDGFYDFGRDLFPKLLELDVNFYGFVTDDYWSDIGTLKVYHRAHTDAFNRPSLINMALKDGLYTIKKNCLMGLGTTLDLSADIGSRVYIGRNCHIGSNVRLNNCIIWDNCTVRENATIDNAIIGYDCVIGQNSVVKGGSVIGNNSRLGKDVYLDKKALVEPNSKLTAGRTNY
ncbi:MAG: NDP-sugar synthase [Peptococcaceae bacterium]|nr:NDP-sugar synthase [Peptococcaceae bacterium]